MSVALYRITITQPGDIPPRVFDFWDSLVFDDQVGASATRIDHPDLGDWAFSWIVAGNILLVDVLTQITLTAAAVELDDLISLNSGDINITPVPDVNWLAQSYRGFPPQNIARFFLRGSHDVHVPVPSGLTPITIDAATAFGSGEHPTTRGCLVLLDQLGRGGFDPAVILDLGTGSGILGIAAAKIWPAAKIVAVDNDPESVRVAAEYAALNATPLTCLLADTPAAPDVAAPGPYPLVIANILAGPLRDLAPAIADVATPDAQVILSGLLDRQIDEVLAAYTPFGFTLAGQHLITDWAALHLVRTH